MGYLRHKYTRTYLLKEDSSGNITPFGMEGINEFKSGDIREQDKEILRCLRFEGKKVLEFGFGRGEAIKHVLDNGGSSVVGVDFSKDANIVAKEFLESYGMKAELYCEDAIAFLKTYIEKNRNGGYFDVVLMLDFVEHVPRIELKEMLVLLHKVISSRSIIAINTPVFKADNDVILEGLKPEARDTGDEFEETAGMHCNRYTKESLENFMRVCGFQAVSGHFFMPISSTQEPLEGDGQQRWRKAFELGYPISEEWVPAKFEYALPYLTFAIYQQLQQEHQALVQEHQALVQEHQALQQEYHALQQEHQALVQSRAVQFAREMGRHPVLLKAGKFTYGVLAGIFKFFKG